MEATQDRWYQYSLRDFLFVIVVLVALGSLMVRFNEESFEPVGSKIEPTALLEAICKDANLPLEVPGLSNNVGGGISSWSSEYSLVLKGATLKEFRQKVMPEFKTQLLTILQESKCQTDDVDDGTTDGLLSSFNIKFSNGNLRGIIRAYSFEKPDGSIQFLWTMDEW